jgi:plastocyanin
MPKRAPLAFLVVVALAVAALITSIASPATKPKHITVNAVDFKFTKVPRTLAAGKYIITLVNRGEATHDLKLAGKKTKLLSPGQKASITVSLRHGKKYVYLCTVPGHAQLGMKGTIKVK